MLCHQKSEGKPLGNHSQYWRYRGKTKLSFPINYGTRQRVPLQENGLNQDPPNVRSHVILLVLRERGNEPGPLKRNQLDGFNRVSFQFSFPIAPASSLMGSWGSKNTCFQTQVLRTRPRSEPEARRPPDHSAPRLGRLLLHRGLLLAHLLGEDVRGAGLRAASEAVRPETCDTHTQSPETRPVSSICGYVPWKEQPENQK